MTYYVLVTQPKAPEKVLCELSGALQADTFSMAEIEVGLYRDFLNQGQNQVTDTFFIVVAYREGQAMLHADFPRFRDNKMRYSNDPKEYGQMGLGVNAGSSNLSSSEVVL